MRVAHFTLLSLLLASNPVNANLQYNLTSGVTPVSHDIFQLHMTVFGICVAIGIGVFSVLFYSLLFHRKTNGKPPAQFHEHLWVELTWTIVPALILVLIAIPGTGVLMSLNDAAKPDLTIKITGYQWKWKYEYLGQNVSFFSNLSTPFDQLNGKAKKNPNYLHEVDHPLVLPIHKKVRLIFTSNDVIHSWWVPELGVKRQTIPGFITENWTRIQRAGTYVGQCAQLCGVNHGFMPIVVVATTEKSFNDWLAQQKAGTTSATPVLSTAPPKTITTTPAVTRAPGQKYTKDELMKKGEQVYMQICSVCHKPDGTGQPPTFPALKGSAIATGPLPQHFNRVLNGKPGTAMQAFKEQLSNEDLAAVITYERNAWGNNKGDVIQPEEIEAAKKNTALSLLFEKEYA